MRILLGLLLLCAFSCTRPPNSETSGYLTDGAEFKWPINPASGKVEIDVCWENTPNDEAPQRDWVRNIVTAEYGKLNFLFRGWNACLPSGRGIRVVSLDVSDNHVKTFGVKLDNFPQGMVMNMLPVSRLRPAPCERSASALKVCIEVTALHEFGHAIGLRHEADRPDSTCSGDTSFGAGEQGALAVGQYDPESIMNYCATASKMRVPVNPSLSAGDVTVIKEYYFGSAQSPIFSSRGLCESEGNSWDIRSGNGDSCCKLPDPGKVPNATISENPPYKYCPFDLGFDISKLDSETLPADIKAIEAPSFGFQTVCQYANGRRSFSVTKKMTLSTLKTERTIWTALEPQESSMACRVFLFTQIVADGPRTNHLEGAILADSMHPWPEDGIHKISLWKTPTY